MEQEVRKAPRIDSVHATHSTETGFVLLPRTLGGDASCGLRIPTRISICLSVAEFPPLLPMGKPLSSPSLHRSLISTSSPLPRALDRTQSVRDSKSL